MLPSKIAGAAEAFAARRDVHLAAPVHDAPVWVLLGAHHGDNRQLLALAEALERPYRTIALKYRKRLSRLPGVLLGRSLLPLAGRVDWPRPWPRVVLASGRRAVPVARWIQAQAAHEGVATRLIHLGRPRAPLRWFDLVVSTAQYGLPARDNVLGNLLPLRFVDPRDAAAPAPPALEARLRTLPRPWTVALVGGDSRPYYCDAAAAARLARALDAGARDAGGSVLVLGGPRSAAACLDEIERKLRAPGFVHRWRADDNPYPALLRLADRFVVTGDSLAMLGDALNTGKPVEVFALPRRLDRRARIAQFCKAAAARSRLLRGLYAALIDAGLVFSLRDLADCHRRLREAGVFDRPWLARALAARERRHTLARARAVLDEAMRAGLRPPAAPQRSAA